VTAEPARGESLPLGLLENAERLALSRAVDAKSLSRAAAELAVSRATFNRRLARLEERLGVRLLKRTTRSPVLTDAGDVLYGHARILLDAVRAVEPSIRRTDDAIQGDLRVRHSQLSNSTLIDVVADFVCSPRVRLQLRLSNGMVGVWREGLHVLLGAAPLAD